MKFVIMVLVLFATCLFSLTALAKNPSVPANNPLDLTGQRQTGDAVDAGQDDDILRLGGQIKELTDKVGALEKKAKRLGSGTSRRDDIEALQRQFGGLMGVYNDLQKELAAHKLESHGGGSSSTPAPTSQSPPPSDAGTGLDLDRRLRDAESGLLDAGGRLSRLAGDVAGLNDRLRGVERRLYRRAIRFDAGGFGLLSRGFVAAGGLGAVTWPLGQDGDWAVRVAAGGGQGWTNDRLQSVAWLAKADLLYRLESAALGLTGTLAGGTVRDGNRYLSWDGGVTARWEPWSWLFIQASAVSGAALGTHAPIQWVPVAGLLEVGVPVPPF
ncbi:MAG: hypothetical protein HY569_01545 [Candidatus Magasanikbacteria bacterium]|nr:hypothetical protein [Candidatus Magasanikbacteria bacterium]